nr:hypothetical protein CPBEC3_15750 [Clostridium perfringens]
MFTKERKILYKLKIILIYLFKTLKIFIRNVIDKLFYENKNKAVGTNNKRA